MKPKTGQPRKPSGKREKLSLYGLNVEDAIRAAARTGPPASAPSKARRPKRTSSRAAKDAQ